jgi:hypothetical protein
VFLTFVSVIILFVDVEIKAATVRIVTEVLESKRS